MLMTAFLNTIMTRFLLSHSLYYTIIIIIIIIIIFIIIIINYLL
jgi:hypothetical protein